jgi:hypothetical protein
MIFTGVLIRHGAETLEERKGRSGRDPLCLRILGRCFARCNQEDFPPLAEEVR